MGSPVDPATIQPHLLLGSRLVAEQRAVLEERFFACDVCRAVRERDDDLARMLMYTRLTGNDAPDAAAVLS